MQHIASRPRELCSELVSVAWPSRSGERRAVTGNLEEIGEFSALVLAESNVPKGTSVRVVCEFNELKGSVESCTYEPSLGYFLEVRLDPESRWSQQWFTPQHMLRLQQLWQSKSLRPKVFHVGIASGY
jgi:hypothetical protein